MCIRDRQKGSLMEDAVEQLDKLARNVGECTRCEELVACRLRAVPGGGHPHCAVMVVSLVPDPADEKAGLPAGSTLVDGLAEFMPALAASADKVYVTTLMKCVPRTACDLRAPRTVPVPRWSGWPRPMSPPRARPRRPRRAAGACGRSCE